MRFLEQAEHAAEMARRHRAEIDRAFPDAVWIDDCCILESSATDLAALEAIWTEEA